MQAIVELKPWTQAELRNIIKDFPKPRHGQQQFTEEVRSVEHMIQGWSIVNFYR